MSFLDNVYTKNLLDNEKNILFWENYLHNLQSLNLSTFAEKLKVPILVPIGSRIFFRGALKHTNEVTVALGANYFVKCSLKQAEELRQHRIKGAISKLNTFKKEKEYLDNQLSFHRQNLFASQGQEIIEYQTDEEDKSWREQHRKNVKRYMQNRNQDETGDNAVETDDEELFNRLEELELQEELENELLEMKGESDIDLQFVKESFVIKNRASNLQYVEDTSINNKDLGKFEQIKYENVKTTSKHDLLQEVLDKQEVLEKKLIELKNKESSNINREQKLLTRLEEANENLSKSDTFNLNKTEQDLIARLEAMEELDELEDEMDRLDDIIETEYIEEDDEKSGTDSPPPMRANRRVSFVDEDDSETLELTFTHSNMEPVKQPYDPEKGILKPSDIYDAYSSLFNKSTSILKKSNYKKKIDRVNEIQNEPVTEFITDTHVSKEDKVNNTIVVKDVVEKLYPKDENLVNNEKRPVSLFKKRRSQTMLS